MPLKKMKRAIGIDVGTSYIKIVSLLYGEKRIEVEHAILEKTPSQMVVNGVIQYPDDLGEIVYGMLQEHRLKSKHASFSVSMGEESGLVKWTSVPKLKPKELKKAIHAIVEDELSHPVENLYYNWEVLGENEKEKQGALDVMIVGTLKASMDAHLSFLKKTKLKPYYAEVDVFSSMRATTAMQEMKDHSLNRMIVDIRTQDTVLSFIENGDYRYARSIPIGTKNLIQEIMDTRGNSYKEAEEDLILNGCVSEELYLLPFDKQTNAELFNPIVDMLTEEIQMTIDFFKDYSKGNIEEIVLLGGGALIEGIDSYIQQKLLLPTTVSSLESHPEVMVSDEIKASWPIFHAAFGLALKEVRDHV